MMSKDEADRIQVRNKKIGLYWLVGPIVLMVAIFVAYAIVSFMVGSAGDDADFATVARVLSAILGLLGIVAVVGMIVGIPIGIIYLSKRRPLDSATYDPRSGRGAASEIPAEIQGWNWGAAGLSWIWGVSHRVWISLLIFIPVLNLFFWIALGIKGNEWAWRAEKWESVDSFLAAQRKWMPWGIVFFTLGVLITIGRIATIVADSQ